MEPEITKLYRWQEGTLTTAGVLPDGTVDPEGATLAGFLLSSNAASNQEGGVLNAFAHSVVDDGKTILFVSPMSGNRPKQIYLARDGRPTVQISKPVDATGSLPGSTGVELIGAGGVPGVVGAMSEDGRYIWFVTKDKLTADAPEDPGLPKAYRYDVGAGTLTYLPEADFSPSEGVNAYGFLYRTSYDGSRALILSGSGDLEISRVGQPPLVVASDFVDAAAGETAPRVDSRFSQDGNTLVFTSPKALRGETDHPTGTTQLYRYVLGDDQLQCVSCGPADAPVKGSAAISNWTGVGNKSHAEPRPAVDSRALSEDGETVFFDTPWRMVAADRNDVSDVYELRGGKVHLISSGASVDTAGTEPGLGGSFFVDSSASGRDVFFTSVQGLVPTDQDGSYDMYDARVDGGFAAPPPPPTPCSGEACKPPLSESPPGARVGSLAGSGRGNGHGPKTASLKIAKPKTIRGSVGSLRVRVPGPGSISLSGQGVRKVTKRARRAASYHVPVPLSAKSRRTLRKRTQMKIKVRVTFDPKVGSTISKTVTLTFKPVRRAL